MAKYTLKFETAEAASFLKQAIYLHRDVANICQQKDGRYLDVTCNMGMDDLHDLAKGLRDIYMPTTSPWVMVMQFLSVEELTCLFGEDL